MSFELDGRALLVGIGLPTGVAGAALAAAWDELPARVATHWAASGAPDGFLDRGPGLAAAVLVLPAAVGAGLAVLLAPTPRSAPGARLLRALPAGTTGSILGLATAATLAQTGAAGADVRLHSTWFGVAAVAGLAAGALAWAVIPRADALPTRVGRPPSTAPRLEGGPGDAWWHGVARPGRGLALVSLGVAAGLVGAGAVTGAWAPLLPGAVVVPAALLATRFRVTVGAHGVVASGGLAGWPRVRVPLATVESADVTTARPREWGGWGLRLRSRGTAVLTRGGEALRLHRTDGTEVLVTVDGAAEAAAAVNSLLDRATA